MKNLKTGLPEQRELLDWGTAAGAGGDTAVFVVHGMGQQKTFETQAQVADEIEKRVGGTATVTARQILAGEQRIGCLEMKLTDKQGKKRRVDVYEAYWAPLTEGEIGLKEVVSFLFRAGVTSLPRFSFRRWMFGSMRTLSAVNYTFTALAATLVAIASLVAVNAVVAAVVAARLATSPGSWPSNHLLIDLSIPAGVLAVLLLLIGITELLALHVKRRGKKIETPVVWTIWLQAGVFFLGLVGTAIVMGAAIWHHRRARPASWLFAHFRDPFIDRVWSLIVLIAVFAIALAVISAIAKNWWISKMFVYVAGAATFVLLGSIARNLAINWHAVPIEGDPAKGWLWWIPIWALLFAVSWFARGFLVQFVGDVAIYVEPHRVDRFNALREKIKKCVFDTAEVIYRMKAAKTNTARYENIVIVAHSLGSVVAYDTLNALIRRDLASGTKIDVTARTGALITFGSPLDKLAFLFALQRSSDAQEALAGTVQPLIDDAATRPPWVNLYSYADIISGSLDYYGDDVDNKRDPDASIPFAAHVEYWENALLWNVVLNAL